MRKFQHLNMSILSFHHPSYLETDSQHPWKLKLSSHQLTPANPMRLQKATSQQTSRTGLWPYSYFGSRTSGESYVWRSAS